MTDHAEEPGAAMVWCPFPGEAEAREAAKILLKERRITCANIVPRVVSVFEWQGEIAESEEVGVLFKTTADQMEMVVERLGAIHSYDTPAILGWSCDIVLPSTLLWLRETVDRMS